MAYFGSIFFPNMGAGGGPNRFHVLVGSLRLRAAGRATAYVSGRNAHQVCLRERRPRSNLSMRQMQRVGMRQMPRVGPCSQDLASGSLRYVFFSSLSPFFSSLSPSRSPSLSCFLLLLLSLFFSFLLPLFISSFSFFLSFFLSFSFFFPLFLFSFLPFLPSCLSFLMSHVSLCSMTEAWRYHCVVVDEREHQPGNASYPSGEQEIERGEPKPC